MKHPNAARVQGDVVVWHTDGSGDGLAHIGGGNRVSQTQ